jgi:RimJ/RimL family protein N-acetyltransferase
MTAPRFQLEWATPVGQLAAREPTLDEVAAHAAALAGAYNDPANASLMGHADEISAEEVVEHYAEMLDDPEARPFLLFCDGKLAGDGDLRGIRGTSAEFAFMIGARDQQGKGLGTKFALMIYAFGFRQLELEHIYASVVPENTASRRVFEKLGCTLDWSPGARAYAEQPDDLVLSIDRPTFERQNPLPDLCTVPI